MSAARRVSFPNVVLLLVITIAMLVAYHNTIGAMIFANNARKDRLWGPHNWLVEYPALTKSRADKYGIWLDINTAIPGSISVLCEPGKEALARTGMTALRDDFFRLTCPYGITYGAMDQAGEHRHP
jgi:hypothetical protein